MDNIKKIMDFLDSNSDIDSLFDEDKKLYNNFNKIKTLMSKYKNDLSECNHDKEDICAYIDGNLKDKEKIENILNECDYCFSFYTNLKKELSILESLSTPIWFKDKVLLEEKKEILSNLEQEKNILNLKLKEKPPIFVSLLGNLKNNFSYVGSGAFFGGIAVAIFIVFVTPYSSNNSVIGTFNGNISTSNSNIVDNNLYLDSQEDIKNKKFDDAIDKLEKFLEKNPSDINSEWDLAKLYQEKGLKIKSQDHFKSYIEKAKNIKNILDKRIIEAEKSVKN